MHHKRSLIRALTRGLYAGGFILLIAGLLLSAVSSPALAAGIPRFGQKLINLSAATANPPASDGYPAGPTVTPTCSCGSATTTPPGPLPTSSNGGKSSLIFSSGCNCSCTNVQATVCNVGGDMQEVAKWTLYYSAGGNPAVGGSLIASGNVGPLKSGQCTTLNYTPKAAGNFAYHLHQEANSSGPLNIWSNSCLVNGVCFPATATSTPFQPATATSTAGVGTPTHTATVTSTAPSGEATATHTATVTRTPPSGEQTQTPTSTSTATAPPVLLTLTPTNTPKPLLDFNLSAVCGYVGDTTMLWVVANNTNSAADYTWRVSGSDEHGSGHVAAHQRDYFTSSLNVATMRLYVQNELVDSATPQPPCKQLLQLSYTCTATGLDWSVHNPNSFGVDYTWSLDTGESGHGMVPGNTTQVLVSTAKGAHHLTLTWTDSRPGSHTISLSSPSDSCEGVTPTPAITFTPPVTLTNTPAVTHTATATLTSTPTAPFVEITQTATLTTTPIPPTRTFTPTFTGVPPTLTFTHRHQHQPRRHADLHAHRHQHQPRRHADLHAYRYQHQPRCHIDPNANAYGHQHLYRRHQHLDAHADPDAHRRSRFDQHHHPHRDGYSPLHPDFAHPDLHAGPHAHPDANPH